MGHHRKMRFDRMFRAMGPFVAMAAMGGLMAAGKWDWSCGPGPGRGGKFRFNGREGVSLDELDMAGDAPCEVVLACGDNVEIADGPDFAIAVQGSPAARDRLRFVLEDGALFVMRDGTWCDDREGEETTPDETAATVTVTMPAPEKLTIAGSGRVTTCALAAEAEVVIAGSGRIAVQDLATDLLAVTIAGSGQFSAEGTARRLEISVAGSGQADMAALAVEEAEIDIAGSGSVTFACDGEVSANIMGSGNVTVIREARCRVHSMGSGSLVCERAPGSGADKAA